MKKLLPLIGLLGLSLLASASDPTHLIIVTPDTMPITAAETNIAPWIDGYMIRLDWADNSPGQVAVDTTVCTNAPCTQTSSFATADTYIKAFAALDCGFAIRGVSHKCLVNFVLRTINNPNANWNIDTPQWVYSQAWATTLSTTVQNAAYCTSYPKNPAAITPLPPTTGTANINSATCGAGATQCTLQDIQAGVPYYPQTAFLTAKENLYDQFLTYLSTASYLSQVRYISVSNGTGDENTITCATNAGVANTALESLSGSPGTDATLKTAMIAGATALFNHVNATRTSLGLTNITLVGRYSMGVGLTAGGSTDPSWALAEIAIPAAVSNFGVGQNGLKNGSPAAGGSDVLNEPSAFTTCVSPANSPVCTSNNWSNALPTVGGWKYNIMQESDVSNPAGGSANIIDSSLSGTGLQQDSLKQVIQIAQSFGVNVIELGPKEAQCFADFIPVSPCAHGNAIQLAYQDAIKTWANDIDNAACPNNVPLWAATDGPANAPTSCRNNSVANSPTVGPTVTVNANDATDLQTKLTAMACGQNIVLPAGSVYSGNFTIPKISCPTTNWVQIKTSKDYALPMEGARYTTTAPSNNNVIYAPQFGPCYSGVTSLSGYPAFNCPSIAGTYTAQIITPNVNPALTFAGGTGTIRLTGLEITQVTGIGEVFDLIKLGDQSTDVTGNVTNVVLDRVWCHGTEFGDETNRCVRTNATNYFSSRDSYYSQMKCISVSGACTDSKAIGGGTNTFTHITEGPTEIENNFISAAGENIIFGGGASNTIPADTYIAHNLFFKPLTWLPIDPSYNGGYSRTGVNCVTTPTDPSCHPPNVKNLFEIKSSSRLLMEGNQFINTWGGFTQHGQAITITPATQGGACLICFDQDIIIRYNQSSSSNGFALMSETSGVDGSHAAGNHWSVHDIVADNIGYGGPDSAYSPSSQSMISSFSDYFITTSGQAINNAVICNHCTMVYASNSTTRNVLGISGPTIASGFAEFNMTFTNNVVQSGFGVTNTTGGGHTDNCANTGSGGAVLIPQCWAPTLTFGGNCFVANGIRTWPLANSVPNVTSVASQTSVFTNWNNGNGGNYSIAPGACKGAASDGTDPGADLITLNSVLSGNPVIAPVAGSPTVTNVSPNNGRDSGGTPVTITGTNFVNGATVTFGGAAATSVVVVSSTTITAITPANPPGTVSVSVTVSGNTGTLNSAYTYTGIRPAPPASLFFLISQGGFSHATHI